MKIIVASYRGSIEQFVCCRKWLDVLFIHVLLLAAMPLYAQPRILFIGGIGGHFLFTRKRLGGICSNYAYAFIVLLINNFPIVSWIEILV